MDRSNRSNAGSSRRDSFDDAESAVAEPGYTIEDGDDENRPGLS